MSVVEAMLRKVVVMASLCVNQSVDRVRTSYSTKDTVVHSTVL